MKRTLLLVGLFCFHLAAEPLTARLEGIVDSGRLLMRGSEGSFECRPYGVLTYERVAESQKIPPECREAIDRFRENDPEAAFAVGRWLRPMQYYRIEWKEGMCLLYDASRVTYSQRLLERGLALISPRFSDREWGFRFRRAQEAARINRRGVWGVENWRTCRAVFGE